MIRVSWPDSQIYNQLTEDELMDYEDRGIIVYGNDCSYCIDEDYYEEITDLCWRRYYGDEPDQDAAE